MEDIFNTAEWRGNVGLSRDRIWLEYTEADYDYQEWLDDSINIKSLLISMLSIQRYFSDWLCRIIAVKNRNIIVSKFPLRKGKVNGSLGTDNQMLISLKLLSVPLQTSLVVFLSSYIKEK